MAPTRWALLLVFPFFFIPIGTSSKLAAGDEIHAIARAFEGLYDFNYVFAENGVPYFDEASHRQLIEISDGKGDSAPRVSLFHLAHGMKRLHFSFVLLREQGRLILREFDLRGNRRFDCVGTYHRDKNMFECTAEESPKPVRDTDTPLTRKLGLFRRPTSWPDYESLRRHNMFRFYDWGFLHIQENLKVDSKGNTVARETGAITAIKVKAP